MFPKKVIDNRKKNPSRKISKEVASEVIKRDGICIICRENPIQEIHHVYFGPYRQYDEGRNNADRLCGLCRKCHNDLHFSGGNNYRERTLEYIEKVKKE